MKKLLSFSIVLLLLIGMIIPVQADTKPTKLSAKADKNLVAPGTEVKVALFIEGTNISGKNLITNIEYDEEIFEKVVGTNIEKRNSECIYKDNNNAHELTIVLNGDYKNLGTGKINIAVITFKVKQTSKIGNTKIAFTGKDENGNKVGPTIGTERIEPVEVAINIGYNSISQKALTKLEITKKPEKVAYKIGEKFDPKGMQITAVYEDSNKIVLKENQYTYQPIVELKETDKEITIIANKDLGLDKNGKQVSVTLPIAVSKDGTTIPQTGIEDYSLVIFIVLAIAVVSFIQIRKYKNI